MTGSAAPPPSTPPPPAPHAAPVPLPPPPAVPSDATVVLQSVSKAYGGLVAVSDITLAIRPGVTALLGPNGAGKSTLLRLTCGLTEPSSGTVWVAGGNPRTDEAVRGRIGIVPQQDGVFERQTARSTVQLAAVLSGVDQPGQAAARALAMVELDPDMERPVGTFSKGMRQRVKIAQALVHGPVILVLDEPLNGLDPLQRRTMIALLHRLGGQGITVLVSSHVLEEVERIGSNVVVVSRGRLAAQGDFRQIRSMLDQQPHRIRVSCSASQRVAASLIDDGAVSGCEVLDEMTFEVTTSRVAEFRRRLPAICAEHDVKLSRVQPLDEDLESVFRYLIARAGQ